MSKKPVHKLSKKVLAALAIGRSKAWLGQSARAKAMWSNPEYRERSRIAKSKALTGREGKTTARAEIHPTTKDIVWLAGFLEGEGSFGRPYSERVAAAQVNQEPLRKILRLFGGVIYKHSRSAPNQNQAHIWMVHGARARGVAMTIYPFMSEKRKSQIRKSWAR